MTDLVAWLTEHAATLTALLAIAQMLAQTRRERERASLVAAETVSAATAELRDQLAHERERGEKLERQSAAAAGRERGCQFRVAEIAGRLAEAERKAVLARERAEAADRRTAALKVELDEHIRSLAAGGYRGGS